MDTETELKREKNTHHGHAIKRVRHSLGFKQEFVASKLGITQAAVSLYESKKEIDDEMIQKFAKVLEVSPELLKQLEEDPVTVIIENNTFENNLKVSNIGNYFVEDSSTNNYETSEKMVELFERLLKAEKEKIELLEKLLKERK